MEIVEMATAPAKFSVNALLYRTDLKILFSNTGTFDTPVFDNVGAADDAGVVKMFAGLDADIPVGWIRCDGASKDTTAFAVLFAAIGYEWGGSGANFNVPNFEASNKFPRAANSDGEVAATGGSSTHVLAESEMPSHTHTIGLVSGGGSGAPSPTSAVVAGSTTGATGGGGAHENKPPYASIYFIIKT